VRSSALGILDHVQSGPQTAQPPLQDPGPGDRQHGLGRQRRLGLGEHRLGRAVPMPAHQRPRQQQGGGRRGRVLAHVECVAQRPPTVGTASLAQQVTAEGQPIRGLHPGVVAIQPHQEPGVQIEE